MPSVKLWSFLLDFGRHKQLQTFTCLLKTTRSNLAQLNTNPFPQSGLSTSLLYWERVHRGSWSPFLEDKGARPTDGMLVQNFNWNSSWQQRRSHLGGSSFFPKGGQPKEQCKQRSEKFHPPNHPPQSPLLPLSLSYKALSAFSKTF